MTNFTILLAIGMGCAPFDLVWWQTQCIENLGMIKAWESSKQQILHVKNGVLFTFQDISTSIVRADCSSHDTPHESCKIDHFEDVFQWCLNCAMHVELHEIVKL